MQEHPTIPLPQDLQGYNFAIEHRDDGYWCIDSDGGELALLATPEEAIACFREIYADLLAAEAQQHS